MSAAHRTVNAIHFTWNLREIHHFVQLRSAKQGHISYRHIAQQVYKEVERVHPLLAKYIRVDLDDYALPACSSSL
jgi:thymidylate synthase ThyX